MRINTNVSSLTAQENSVNTNKNIQNSLEKLSSGLRINKASDDASGLAIADKLRTQATSINQGVDNGNSAVTLLQIADKSMAEQSNILDTVKAKLIQANTDTTSDAGREAIRKDINKLLEQLDNIAQQTNYNGNTLLQSGYEDQDGSGELNFQIGENKNDIISGSSIRSNSVGLGGGNETIDEASGSATRNNVVQEGTSIIISTDENVGNTAEINTANASGTQTASDINLSGQLGTLSTSSGNSLTLSNVDAKTAAALDALIINTDGDTQASGTAATLQTGQSQVLGTTGSGSEVVSGVGTVTLTGSISKIENTDGTISYVMSSGATLSFGASYSVASMDVKESQASGTISVGGATAANNLTITNNSTSDDVTVTSSSGGTLTGGQTLSGLKNLGEGELTKEKADEYQTVVDAAISGLNSLRGELGSTQNQVESAVRNLMTQATNVKAAESIIRDVDYAQESSNFNKQNIISQAGSYAISQANSTQQNVLRLLQ